METTLIGHYWDKGVAICSGTALLKAITSDNIQYVIDNTPKCPYNKQDGYKYKEWKSLNLPIIYFTNDIYRPSKDNIKVNPSGYAVIDIDDIPDKEFVTNHPAVSNINYTANGTHIYIHTRSWGMTLKEWQNTYNSIGFEIWQDLCDRYGELQFDGNNASYLWGGYVWNTKWWHNPNYNFNYTPSEKYLSDDIITKMYKKGTYKRAGETILMTAKWKPINEYDIGETMTVLANRNKISEQVKSDFLSMDYLTFLQKYGKEYRPIMGTIPQFSEYMDYEGNIYKMYETKGQMVKLWQPYMQAKQNLSLTADGHFDYHIKIGGRRKSLASHLKQVCQFTADNLNPDHILYDAVNWIYNYCEDGYRFPKLEIMNTLCSMMKSFDRYDCCLYTDKRMFVSGTEMVDIETGEVTKMDKGMKIRANAKCRKTQRIIEIVKHWKPNLSVAENLERIKGREDQYSKLNDRTIMSYLESAKKMPDLVKQFPWLEHFSSKKMNKAQAGLKGGKVSQPITIKNKVTGTVLVFSSRTECRKHIGCSSKTFVSFLKGNSKLNKKYEILTA